MLYLLAAALPAAAEIQDVLKSADLDAAFRAGRPVSLHRRGNFEILLFRAEGPTAGTQPQADQIFYIRHGAGKVSLGGKQYEIAAGDLVQAPRGTNWRIRPASGGLDWIAVQIAPGAAAAPRTGFLAPRNMGDVVKKEQIDATFSGHDSNQPLRAAPNFTMNYVIYQGKSGPWEAHRGCVDIYFLHDGTATAEIGGEIREPREESPGEIRGSGVTGARPHTIGPGDLVVIPRNTAHHMTPSGARLDYLLLKVWAE